MNQKNQDEPKRTKMNQYEPRWTKMNQKEPIVLKFTYNIRVGAVHVFGNLNFYIAVEGGDSLTKHPFSYYKLLNLFIFVVKTQILA